MLVASVLSEDSIAKSHIINVRLTTASSHNHDEIQT